MLIPAICRMMGSWNVQSCAAWTNIQMQETGTTIRRSNCDCQCNDGTERFFSCIELFPEVRGKSKYVSDLQSIFQRILSRLLQALPEIAS
jgi:hypothetical protein